MKKILFTIIFAIVCSTAYSQDGLLTNEEKQELLAASPFNSVYPESILKSADDISRLQWLCIRKGQFLKKKLTL